MESAKYCIIFNPLSGNGRGKAEAEELYSKIVADECIDITKIEDYKSFFEARPNKKIVICGGDGTLNRFVNDTANVEFNNSISYYASGTGNDFLRDIDGKAGEIINIDKYIKDLPVCSINGKDYKFINGIGFGIDGYCCEVGDELRKKSDAPINYTAIAIKGLLFNYKPTGATVTADGVTHRFKKVWIAPTMVGRYYGGGMMATPDQNRLNGDGTLSTMVFHTTGRIRTLMIFPSIFKGEHIKKNKAVTVITGKEITVEFDSPRSLQVDGETLLNIKKYSVRACVPSQVKTEQETTV